MGCGASAPRNSKRRRKYSLEDMAEERKVWVRSFEGDTIQDTPLQEAARDFRRRSEQNSLVTSPMDPALSGSGMDAIYASPRGSTSLPSGSTSASARGSVTLTADNLANVPNCDTGRKSPFGGSIASSCSSRQSLRSNRSISFIDEDTGAGSPKTTSVTNHLAANQSSPASILVRSPRNSIGGSGSGAGTLSPGVGVLRRSPSQNFDTDAGLWSPEELAFVVGDGNDNGNNGGSGSGLVPQMTLAPESGFATATRGSFMADSGNDSMAATPTTAGSSGARFSLDTTAAPVSGVSVIAEPSLKDLRNSSSRAQSITSADSLAGPCPGATSSPRTAPTSQCPHPEETVPSVFDLEADKDLTASIVVSPPGTIPS